MQSINSKYDCKEMCALRIFQLVKVQEKKIETNTGTVKKFFVDESNRKLNEKSVTFDFLML